MGDERDDDQQQDYSGLIPDVEQPPDDASKETRSLYFWAGLAELCTAAVAIVFLTLMTSDDVWLGWKIVTGTALLNSLGITIPLWHDAYESAARDRL